MNRWLVFGLSGAVGAALRTGGVPVPVTIDAVSRAPRDGGDGLRWLRGQLDPALRVDPGYDAVVSLGPLDAFADWFDACGPATPVVVALGSSGVHDKAGSPDAAERALAARLAAAEARLAAACARRGTRLVLLRPALLWGGHADAFAPLRRFARRWRMLPLPRGARGLRQPVHVADVAAAVRAVLDAPAVTGPFDLPGGETLPWDGMVRRALAATDPGLWTPAVPDGAVAAALAVAGQAGRLQGVSAILARARRDQLHDARPAAAAFGWAPRPFRPDHTQEHCLSVTNN